MAVFTFGALIIGGVLTYLGIGALATLANVISVFGGLGVFAALTYNLIENDLLSFLPFESDFWEAASALVFSAAVGVLSYKLFQAVFTVSSIGFVLTAVLIGIASSILGPRLVFGLIGDLVKFLVDIVGGE